MLSPGHKSFFFLMYTILIFAQVQFIVSPSLHLVQAYLNFTPVVVQFQQTFIQGLIQIKLF